MISNQILQNTIDGLKGITRIDSLYYRYRREGACFYFP